MKKIKFLFRKIDKLVLVPIIVFALVFGSCEDIIDLDPYNQIGRAHV